MLAFRHGDSRELIFRLFDEGKSHAGAVVAGSTFLVSSIEPDNLITFVSSPLFELHLLFDRVAALDVRGAECGAPGRVGGLFERRVGLEGESPFSQPPQRRGARFSKKVQPGPLILAITFYT
jgi:hypothetical protein